VKTRNLSPRERRKLYRIFHRIYALFNEGGWKVKYHAISGNHKLCDEQEVSRTATGFIDEDIKIIWVDYREEILAILIHECLHIIYPDASENKIMRPERHVMRHMSRIQAVRLIRHTSRFLC
jgi:hypothetical protein